MLRLEARLRCGPGDDFGVLVVMGDERAVERPPGEDRGDAPGAAQAQEEQCSQPLVRAPRPQQT